jgi:flagellar biosynthesis chaperone FliJ
MFSTLFYIFILFYDGLYSRSSKEYNGQISQLNTLIAKHQYKEALVSAKVLQHSSIFVNIEIEKLIAVLELKTHQKDEKSIHLALNDYSIANDILFSHIEAQNGDIKKGLADLQFSIIKNGNLDTLVKAYELYTINFPQNKFRKRSSSTQVISQSQKINTQEALSLLDLMKKKQKNLLY